MRILMLGDARTEHLARWARHFRARGDEVLVASAEGGTSDVHLALPVRWQALGYPLLVPVLKRLTSEWRPDLVVSHYLPNYGLLTVLSKFRPHVVVGWGSDLLVLPRRGILQRSRLRYVATRAQAFLVDAQMLVQPLVKLGAPAERVYVCPFGVDDDVLNLEPKPASSGTPSILSNRQLEHRYRVDVLVDACSKLSAPFDATIANDGAARPRLERQVSQLNLQSKVRFRGHLDRTSYLDSLRQSDLYVSTSPSDSTSVSLLEAMAAGLACVVPDIEGNREWIADGKNGLLYPPLNAYALASQLESLVSDPAKVRTLGTKARQTIQTRGRWSHTIRRAELLFSQLVRAEPCRAS
jgi:glycosyltransferase involved in cell wall biosynthesis